MKLTLPYIQADLIHDLGEQIGTTLANAEEIGAEGNVDESLKLMQEVEDLKKKKAAAEVRIQNGSILPICVRHFLWSLAGRSQLFYKPALLIIL